MLKMLTLKTWSSPLNWIEITCNCCNLEPFLWETCNKWVCSLCLVRYFSWVNCNLLDPWPTTRVWRRCLLRRPCVHLWLGLHPRKWLTPQDQLPQLKMTSGLWFTSIASFWRSCTSGWANSPSEHNFCSACISFSSAKKCSATAFNTRQGYWSGELMAKEICWSVDQIVWQKVFPE